MKPFRYGGVVSGDSFCARPRLEKTLQTYVENCQNAVIIGARRMGKTSLIHEATRKMKGVRVLYADLLNVRTLADFCDRMASGASRMTSSKGIVQKTLGFLSRLRPTFSLDSLTGSPVISVDARLANETASIDDVLNMVAAHRKDGKLCVVLDEFQEVLKMDNPDQVLALLRSRIQFMDDVCFLYSGNVRSQMVKIFSNPDSPFYKSALTVSVGPIDDADFIPFIRGRFKSAKRRIDDDLILKILDYTGRVSGDVQELCDSLWQISEPGDQLTGDSLKTAIEEIFRKENDAFTQMTAELTKFQLKALTAIARYGGRNVFSAEFMSRAGLPSSPATKRALDRLMVMNVLYCFEHEYRFFNHFFRDWLLR